MKNYSQIRALRGYSFKDFTKGDKVILASRDMYGREAFTAVQVVKVEKVNKASIKLANGLALSVWDYDGSLDNFWRDFDKNYINICEVTGDKFEANFIEKYSDSRYNLIKESVIAGKEAKALSERRKNDYINVKSTFEERMAVWEAELDRKAKALWVDTVCTKCKNYNPETGCCMTRFADGGNLKETTYNILNCTDFSNIVEVL